LQETLMTIAEFQKHILTRYGQRDKERGVWPTFGWFIEEVGELASAMHATDHVNKEEEFADVLAWLMTLANIEGVDMEAAIQRKYFTDGGPKGHK
jgi:NTP pyrophosphatase (non-canonical NTP hydrolase)